MFETVPSPARGNRRSLSALFSKETCWFVSSLLFPLCDESSAWEKKKKKKTHLHNTVWFILEYQGSFVWRRDPLTNCQQSKLKFEPMTENTKKKNSVHERYRNTGIRHMKENWILITDVCWSLKDWFDKSEISASSVLKMINLPDQGLYVFILVTMIAVAAKDFLSLFS